MPAEPETLPVDQSDPPSEPPPPIVPGPEPALDADDPSAAPAQAPPPPPEPVAAPPPEPEEPPPPNKWLDPSIKFGVGLRTQYALGPGVGDDDFFHAIGFNIRPYISGQVNQYIKFEANLDSAVHLAVNSSEITVDPATGALSAAPPDGEVIDSPLDVIRPLDAVVKLELHPLANFWIGRFLPPGDRSNLSGPYFMSAWNYPVDTNLFPAIYAGRQDGIAYWGRVKEGLFKWQVGMFDVRGGQESPLLAGRVVLNLLDPEPGYYNSSTYYGTQDVLAFGLTAQYQFEGEGGTGLDGAALEADVLFEKTTRAAGTFTLEGAYYGFQLADQGQSGMALFSYLAPGRQGIGALQPMIRAQFRDLEVGDTFVTIDGALNYIVNGHNARFALNYQYRSPFDDDNGVANDASHLITLGAQIQL